MKAKHVLAAFGAMTFIMLFAYCLGCLATAETNIKLWNPEMRGCIFILSGMVSLIVGVSVALFLSELDPKK